MDNGILDSSQIATQRFPKVAYVATLRLLFLAIPRETYRKPPKTPLTPRRFNTVPPAGWAQAQHISDIESSENAKAEAAHITDTVEEDYAPNPGLREKTGILRLNHD